MSSLLTNNSAMTALLSLSQTQTNLNTTESEVSTGLKIQSAEDNATYWSISTSMSSQVDALGAVSSALSESSAMLSVMSNALQQTISVMDAIQNDLTTALQPGSDLSKIQTDITAQQQQLIGIGTSSVWNGLNFLGTSGGTVSLVSSYDMTNGASFINIDTSSTALFGTEVTSSSTAGSTSLSVSGTAGSGGVGILDAKGAAYTGGSVLTWNVSSATSGDINNMLTDLRTALTSIETAASTLGADQTQVSSQQTFVSVLSNQLTSGVGAMVDANMNAVSTRIAALQVQQELGVQALSIANQNTQTILRLFQ